MRTDFGILGEKNNINGKRLRNYLQECMCDSQLNKNNNSKVSDLNIWDTENQS